jgi:hypothetical protein
MSPSDSSNSHQGLDRAAFVQRGAWRASSWRAGGEAEGDDPGGTQAVRDDDGRQARRGVSHDGDHAALPDADAQVLKTIGAGIPPLHRRAVD